jgi:RimJ/RimL family protein N-acetyltransferase
MIIGNKVRLREKRLADAVDDYAWEIDPELAKLDASIPLAISFPQYLSEYASGLRHLPPTRHLFAIETIDGNHIGNCVYYGVDEAKSEAELGIMIGNRNYWNEGYGTDAVATLINHIFSETKLIRIYLKTLDWNTRAQECFQNCGFTPCGHVVKDGYNLVLMELQREPWERRKTGKSSGLLTNSENCASI